MATTYNFTVRAEDNEGAFADRDFSISVRNTVVDRYMIIDTTDAYTSADMVNWTKRIGQGGRSVIYAGGKWVIRHDNGYRLSLDGVNFSNYTTATAYMNPENPSAPSNQLSPLSYGSPQYHNGSWYMNCVTSAFGQCLFKSTDAVNWMFEAILTPSLAALAGISDQGPLQFEGNEILYKESMKGTTYNVYNITTKTATSVTPTLPVASQNSRAAPRKINDLWTMFGYSNSGAHNAYYSPDRQTWYMGSITGTSYGHYTEVDMYHNGMLLIKPRIDPFLGGEGSSNGYAPRYSTDGKTWALSSTGYTEKYGVNKTSGFISAQGKLFWIGSFGARVSTNLGKSFSGFFGLPTPTGSLGFVSAAQIG